jgi:hypothetical protein
VFVNFYKLLLKLLYGFSKLKKRSIKANPNKILNHMVNYSYLCTNYIKIAGILFNWIINKILFIKQEKSTFLKIFGYMEIK